MKRFVVFAFFLLTSLSALGDFKIKVQLGGSVNTYSDSTTGYADVTQQFQALCNSSGTGHAFFSNTEEITSSDSRWPPEATTDNASLVYYQTTLECTDFPSAVGTAIWGWQPGATPPAAGCGDYGGKFFEWNDDFGPMVAGSWDQAAANIEAKNSWQGRAICEKPSSSSSGSCRAHVSSASCQPAHREDGDYSVCTGTAYFDSPGTACLEGDKQPSGSAAQNLRDEMAVNGSKTGVSGGGQGVTGGTNADSENLARIASNTDRIARGMTSAANGGDPAGGSSDGSGVGGSCGGDGQRACSVAGQCGGPGQPACKIDEGGTSSTGLQATVDAAKQGVGDGLTSMLSGLDGSATPGFTPEGGHWMPRFTSLLPAASCSFPMNWSLPFSMTFTTTFSACGWGDYARDVLGLVMYGLTMLFIFWTIFRGN